MFSSEKKEEVNLLVTNQLVAKKEINIFSD